MLLDILYATDIGSDETDYLQCLSTILKPIQKALLHGFKLLRGGSGTDVHPPRHTIHQEGTNPIATAGASGSQKRPQVDECGCGHVHDEPTHVHDQRTEKQSEGEKLSIDPSHTGMFSLEVSRLRLSLRLQV